MRDTCSKLSLFMQEVVFKMIIGLLGGLALFIYGMQEMGDGLEKVAGNRLKSILATLTGNPFLGILVGALVTAVMQSSSATTVIAVGFVSAGLMTLRQAFGVIMGANIGTTITAWIVAINIGDYVWAFVAIGFLMLFLLKKPGPRYLGQIIFAFGVLFVGLNTMSASMAPLAESKGFQDLLMKIKDLPLVGFFVGTGTTLVVQSSSASLGLLQMLSGTAKDAAGTPLISMYQAIPILLGSNVGTTITTIFASFGTRSKEAKRVAAAHSIFNLIGSLVFMVILVPFTKFMNLIFSYFNYTMLADSSGLFTPGASYMRQSIAMTHTVFNLGNTLMWLPFIWLMVKIVKLVVPGEDPVNERELKYANYSVIHNPAVAIDLVTKEIARMGDTAYSMVDRAHEMFMEGADAESVDEMLFQENTLDFLENEIVKYLSTLISGNTLTIRNSNRVTGLMHVTNDIERIGDYCMNIANSLMEMTESKIVFSDIAKAELDQGFSLIKQIVADSTKALRGNNLVLAGKIMTQEDMVDEMEVKLRAAHFERLDEGLCNPQSTVIYLEILHTMERISDHCNNIAEFVIMGATYVVHKEKGQIKRHKD